MVGDNWQYASVARLVEVLYWKSLLFHTVVQLFTRQLIFHCFSFAFSSSSIRCCWVATKTRVFQCNFNCCAKWNWNYQWCAESCSTQITSARPMGHEIELIQGNRSSNGLIDFRRQSKDSTEGYWERCNERLWEIFSKSLIPYLLISLCVLIRGELPIPDLSSYCVFRLSYCKSIWKLANNIVYVTGEFYTDLFVRR